MKQKPEIIPEVGRRPEVRYENAELCEVSFPRSQIFVLENEISLFEPATLSTTTTPKSTMFSMNRW